MEESLYDEFGNYIGPELSASEEVRQSTALAVSEPLHNLSQHILLDAMPQLQNLLLVAAG